MRGSGKGFFLCGFVWQFCNLFFKIYFVLFIKKVKFVQKCEEFLSNLIFKQIHLEEEIYRPKKSATKEEKNIWLMIIIFDFSILLSLPLMCAHKKVFIGRNKSGNWMKIINYKIFSYGFDNFEGTNIELSFILSPLTLTRECSNSS